MQANSVSVTPNQPVNGSSRCSDHQQQHLSGNSTAVMGDVAAAGDAVLAKPTVPNDTSFCVALVQSGQVQPVESQRGEVVKLDDNQKRCCRIQ